MKAAELKIDWHGFMVPSDCEFERLQLSKQNVHPRDHRIVFRDRDHVYFIDGEKGDYTSVTSVIKNQFDAFDAEKVARSMVVKPAFCNGKVKRYALYQPMRWDVDGRELSVDELVDVIKLSWIRNGQEQSALGTTMHRRIELYYNGIQNPDPPTKEFGHFLSYDKEMRNLGFNIWRTEMTVFGEEQQVCGSVDAIYTDADGRFRLRDWKRSKEISFMGYGKTGKGELAHLADSNYWHYSLQLNLYRFLLEKYYQIHIFDMGIVVFHPNNETYLEFIVKPMDSDISKLLEQHKRQQQAAKQVAEQESSG